MPSSPLSGASSWCPSRGEQSRDEQRRITTNGGLRHNGSKLHVLNPPPKTLNTTRSTLFSTVHLVTAIKTPASIARQVASNHGELSTVYSRSPSLRSSTFSRSCSSSCCSSAPAHMCAGQHQGSSTATVRGELCWNYAWLHCAIADGSFSGLVWKCARIGERLSPYVSLACVVMAVMVLTGGS